MPIILIVVLVTILVVSSLSAVFLGRGSAKTTIPVPNLSTPSDKKHRYMRTMMLEWGDHIDKHGVGAWLHSLPLDQLNVLTNDVAAYAKDMGFDLLWLLDNQIDDVDLHEHVTQTIFKYVQSFFIAAEFQDDLELYKVLVEFLNNMGTRRHRTHAEKIYKRLNTEGVIPDADAEVLFKNRATRIHHIEEAIREAAQSHRSALKLAVRDIIINKEV